MTAAGALRSGRLDTDPNDGLLHLRVVDATTKLPLPCRVAFAGTSGTRTPSFSDDDLPAKGERLIAAYNTVLSLDGQGSVAVPPGSYHVVVSHGIEWTTLETDLTVTQGGGVLEGELRRAFETPGYLSADLHVHAASSFDSRVPMEARVHQFVADGVDFIVSTDHNIIADYAPVIRALGVQDLLASTTGDEITTSYEGHFGAFPLPLVREAPRLGAIGTRGRTPAQIFAATRKRSPGGIIDVHHPRYDRALGYFNESQFNPITLKAKKKGFSLDFDALELLNGYEDPERIHFEQAFSDWLAMLRAGRVVTATGNSDTHHLRGNIGGFPRNFIKVPDDRPSAVSTKDLVDGIKAHHALFTTGPYVEVSAEEGSMGDTVKAEQGKLGVHVVVRAAPWVAVDRLNVYVDGDMVQTIPIETSSDAVRFDRTLALTFAADSFVVFRVEGDTPLPIFLGQPNLKVLPIAVTNPLFVEL